MRTGFSGFDTSNNETCFDIERSSDNVATFQPLKSVGVNVTGYVDTNLPASTKFVYRVRAINGLGESGWSNNADATTSPAPADPGPGSTTLRVDAAGASSYTDSAGKVWSADAGFVGGYANTGTFAVDTAAELAGVTWLHSL